MLILMFKMNVQHNLTTWILFKFCREKKPTGIGLVEM